MNKYKDLILKYLSLYTDQSNTQIAQIIINENDTDCRSVDRMRKHVGNVRGEYHDQQGQQTFSSDNNTASYEYKGRKSITSLDEAIQFFKIDTKKWDVDKFTVNSWDVTNKRGETFTNYQVKVFLVKKQIKTDPKLFVDYIKDNLKSPLFPGISYKIKEDSKLLEVGIHDFHFGKQAWADEVGMDYDLKIAEDIYNNTIDTIVQRTSHYQYEQIYYIVGSDFFNVDSFDNLTTKGTRQDEDTRWQKTFSKGINIVTSNSMKLSKIAPVKIIVISGNHDLQRAYYLGSVLDAYFRNCDYVEVDNEPRKRKYYQYGNCGIGIAHGDKIKERSWNEIFAAEAPEIWGNTKYREMHTGDKHHLVKKPNTITINENDTVREFKGCTFRITRSIASIDDFHYSHGYVGTIRGTEAFVWDKKAGLINIINANL